MTNVMHKFFSMYFFLFITLYMFEHVVLIIRRDKLYQYSLW